MFSRINRGRRETPIIFGRGFLLSTSDRKSGSHQTRRWREMDSNHRFRLRYSPSGSSLVVSADLSTLPSRKRSSQRTQRWREQDSNHRSRVTRPIFQVASGWFPPTEKSERKRTDTRSVGPFPRGTDGSNPVPSTGESSANLTSSPGSRCAGHTVVESRLRFGRFISMVSGEENSTKR